MEVAKCLCLIYAEVFTGDYSTVTRMAAAAVVGAKKSRRQVYDNDGTLMGEDSGGESSSDDEMAEGGDAPGDRRCARRCWPKRAAEAGGAGHRRGRV
jgi:hypothetical protein